MRPKGERALTKEEVFRLLVLIESVYPNFVLKNDIVLDWFRLGPYLDFETIMKMLHSHIRESPYPPTLQYLMMDRKVLMHDAQKGIFGYMQKSVSSWMHEYSIK